MEEYLEKFWQFYIPGVMELYKSITEVLGNKTKGMWYSVCIVYGRIYREVLAVLYSWSDGVVQVYNWSTGQQN